MQIADGAIASGRVHPRARDRWLVELAAGGRRGAQAVARLMALAPGPPGTGVAASGSPRPLNDEQVWALMYPTAEQAWAHTAWIETDTGRQAAKFARSQQAYDNSLAATKGIEASRAAAAARTRKAAPDADLYEQLFGRETGSS